MKHRAALLAAVIVIAGLPQPADAALADADVTLTLVETLDEPIGMATRTGDTALYVAEKGGKVQKLDGGPDPTTILDISSKVSGGSEQGLLGLTFSPSGDAMYVNYTNLDGDTVVRRYAFDGGVVGSFVKVIKVIQPFSNHNGGNIAFSPHDDLLYIGMGDGGAADDPGNRAQSLDSLLGKMLRIDPLPEGGYTIPADNPFVGRTGRDEIWAFGLRNPWRWSFDTKQGNLWIGDVGQNQWEEVDRQQAISSGGENYGWRRMEGTHEHLGTAPPDHRPPVFEYDHSNGRCSITGGYVYRGTDIPDLFGAYLFADFCEGEIKAFMPADPRGTKRKLGLNVPSISSFGQDNDGELYAMSLSGGQLYRIDAVT
jgi:glucose/arabinose dehydrogenase